MTKSGDLYSISIAQGTSIIYQNKDGEFRTASVTNVDTERELVDCYDVPGVFRLEDIVAVGVYGDEAEFHLDGMGTGDDRIKEVSTDE